MIGIDNKPAYVRGGHILAPEALVKCLRPTQVEIVIFGAYNTSIYNGGMSAPQPRVHPEAYYLQKGTYVPNNRLPALVYRNVLPRPLNRESAKALCEGNHWERRVRALN